MTDKRLPSPTVVDGSGRGDQRHWPESAPVRLTEERAGVEAGAVTASLEAGRPIEHVLVVEDEAPMRSIIRRNLERRGIRVDEARTAAEATAALAAFTPDLLVLDINLPDRTGWDVLREVRLAGRMPRTVVVSAVRVSPERLREFAIDGYLPKPFPIESLIGLVTGGARGS